MVESGIICVACALQTHHFSFKEVPGGAMAAADGPGRVGGAPQRTDGGGILFGAPQRTHSLQRPQQSQSRGRSQGTANNYI